MKPKHLGKRAKRVRAFLKQSLVGLFDIAGCHIVVPKSPSKAERSKVTGFWFSLR